MSIKVPRAPRADEAPDAVRRMGALREAVRAGKRTGSGRGELPVVPIACGFAGLGALLVILSVGIELWPRSLLAQFLVVLCKGLAVGR